MSRQRSRMDIQANEDYKIFYSNEQFIRYMHQPLGGTNVSEHNALEVLKDYTNEAYIQINGFLRKGNYDKDRIQGFFLKNENTRLLILGDPIRKNHERINNLLAALEDGIYMRDLIKIEQGTVVYRGVVKKPPFSIGQEFYFPEFISTSLSESVAKDFGNYIFVITLYGKGFKGVEKVSYYPNEKEVLIEAYSKFRITDIRGNYYYMDKLEKNN